MEEELRNSGTNIIMEIWPRPCGGLLSVGSSRGFEFKCEGFGSEGGGYSVQPQTQTVVFAGRQSAADVPIWGMFHRVSVLPAMQRDSGFYLIGGGTTRQPLRR